MRFDQDPRTSRADSSTRSKSGSDSDSTSTYTEAEKQSNIQLSITVDKLNKINKAARETTKTLNDVFSSVSGTSSSDVTKTFDDLTNSIQTAASALDTLTKQASNPDAVMNNVEAVQAQFDGLKGAYANINSKLSDLLKSTDNNSINDVDKIIYIIEKMEQSTSDVSKPLKKSLQKMAEESGNTTEIDGTLKTLESNFSSVSEEIKSKFNELIQKQIQDIVSGMQDNADESLVAISNGRGLQKKFNQSITNTGDMAAGVYQDAVVVEQMNNRQHFWNKSKADFGGIANTASEMGVMQTKYEHVSTRVKDAYTNAEQEQDPEKRKQLIKEANEQYKNLVTVQKAMNTKAKELGKQMRLVSPDDLKRLGQEGQDLSKKIKKILAETSANSGRVMSIGAAFNVKDNDAVAEGFAKDKAELDKVNNSLDDVSKKTGDLAKTVKNDLSSAFNTLMAPFKMIGKFLPLLGAGGMFGLMNNITKPLKYYSEKHKDMYTSMGVDSYAGVSDLGQSQAAADSRLMRGNELYAASGGMIDRRAINNSYNSAMKEVGGAYGSSPEQGAADMNELVGKTALMQNVWGIDQGTMNNAYQTFYKDMRMNASDAADAIARVAQTAQASGIPVAKYLHMISGLAHDFMKIGIDGDKAESVMAGLLGKGMRADVAQDIAGQSANAMGGFAQNYNMVGYAAAMQGMDPFHGLALASYSHEANGEVRKGWGSDMSKMMDTMLNQYSMAYGDDPDVKRFGVTDTLKKQFGFSQRAASTLTSSYLKGDTKQFEEMFEKEMDKKENPNGALEEVNKQLVGQLGEMTNQLAGSDKLAAQMDAKLYGAADTLGKHMDSIITKLSPLLNKFQDAVLELAKNILKFIDTFLHSKLWTKLVDPALTAMADHPAATAVTAMGTILAGKGIKHFGNIAKNGGVRKALKDTAKGAGWKVAKYAGMAGMAYEGWNLLTGGSKKKDDKDGKGNGDKSPDSSLEAAINDDSSPGGIFDKIYDALAKIYAFISGQKLPTTKHGSKDDKHLSVDDVKDEADKHKDMLPMLGAAGLLGYAGIKKFHLDDKLKNAQKREKINKETDNLTADASDKTKDKVKTANKAAEKAEKNAKEARKEADKKAEKAKKAAQEARDAKEEAKEANKKARNASKENKAEAEKAAKAANKKATDAAKAAKEASKAAEETRKAATERAREAEQASKDAKQYTRDAVRESENNAAKKAGKTEPNHSDKEIQDKLDDIANGNKDSKKAANEAGKTANKDYTAAQKEHSQARTRYNELNKKAQENIKAGRTNSKNAIKNLNAAKANLTKTGLKLHQEQLKGMGRLGKAISLVEKGLSRIFGKGIGSVFTKIETVWNKISGAFKKIGKGISSFFGPLKSILAKIGGVALSALDLGSDALQHLWQGDYVDGDATNSVVNNAIPTALTALGGYVGSTLGGLVGSVVPGAGTAAGIFLGGAAGAWLGSLASDELNNTDIVKSARNGLLKMVGDDDESQDQKRREQKAWAYDKNGNYKFADDYVAPEPKQETPGPQEEKPNQETSIPTTQEHLSAAGFNEDGSYNFDEHDKPETKQAINDIIASTKQDSATFEQQGKEAEQSVLKETGVTQEEASNMNANNPADTGDNNTTGSGDVYNNAAAVDNAGVVNGSTKQSGTATDSSQSNDLLNTAGVSSDEVSAVASGNDSGEDNKQRKSDDSRMKASKDNSDKVVGQAKKEEKLSTTRNKQIQMFQNLHKQLMQMFQASVKEEHGNLWKKLDIMEHILFDINNNIISCGKILNKGLANRGGGGLNYDFTKDHGATAEQLNKKLTGALAGQGDLIIKLAKENGIDAAAIVAIACAESGGGANSTGNNFFGLMDSSHHLQSFSSVEEGIMAEIRTLKGFAKEGKTTLGAIQKEYCPDSEGGANWGKNVGGALTDMGMQVPAGGDSSNNNNYTISGGDFDDMQEATKNFFYAIANAWKSAHPELAGLEFSSGKRDGDPSASHHNDGGAFDVDNGYFEDASLRAEYVSLINSMGGVGLDEWHGTPGAVWAHGDNIHATAPGNGGRDGSYDGSGGNFAGGGDVMPDVQWADQDTIDGYNQYQSMSTTESNNITGLDTSQYEITTDANGVEHQTLKQPGVVMANGKPVDRFTEATRKKIEENLAKGLAPNGEKYLQNDIDYLKAHGYTDMEEIKIALNLDKKYAMAADNPEFLKLMAEKPGWAKSSISIKSPFATGAYYYHHMNNMNAYWTNNNEVGANPDSIYATLLKQSGAAGNIQDHIKGMKMARDQLNASRKGFKAGIPATSYFLGAEDNHNNTKYMPGSSSNKTPEIIPTTNPANTKKPSTGNTLPNNASAAAGLKKAAEDAKKAAEKAKAAAAKPNSSSVANGSKKPPEDLTNPAINKQDNSALTNAGDNTKEESVIDVNINVDNAEDAFLRKFGELLKDAIEKTGARVTSLENHTSEIAKAADYMSSLGQ